MDSTTRFSRRVENYKRYRPGYPAETASFLGRSCSLEPGAKIADIGSGTGLLSQVFVDAGYSVIGVEPNREMREASPFPAIDATAEVTTLPDSCVDLAVAGQAFHWFDPAPTRAEWLRILRPPAWVALIWNERFDGTPFMAELGAMIDRYALMRDADGTIREAGKGRIAGFFAPNGYEVTEFPNRQLFDFEALRGRVCSSSYLPDVGDPHYEPMAAELRQMFNRHERAGIVEFEYRTRIYHGCLA
jgi:SAM-dependent methyltransferase